MEATCKCHVTTILPGGWDMDMTKVTDMQFASFRY
jgi:hypothetical protein